MLHLYCRLLLVRRQNLHDYLTPQRIEEPPGERVAHRIGEADRDLLACRIRKNTQLQRLRRWQIEYRRGDIQYDCTVAYRIRGTRALVREVGKRA